MKMIKETTPISIEEDLPSVKPELPALSIDILIATLADPKARATSIYQLDKRIAFRKSELEKLMMAKRALEIPVQNKIGKKHVSVQKENHISAILLVLKEEKDGLTISEISAKMVDVGHSIERKNLAYYIWSMGKDGKIIKKGERGHFKYRINIQ